VVVAVLGTATMIFISTNILWTNLTLFNNPFIYFCLLPKDDQDRLKHVGVLTDSVKKYVLTLVHLLVFIV
jgi:hypothetical protein